jgi:GNAT superfamily N-acetyltransferase
LHNFAQRRAAFWESDKKSGVLISGKTIRILVSVLASILSSPPTFCCSLAAVPRNGGLRPHALSQISPKWEQGFLERDPSAHFLALALAPVTGEFLGTVTGLRWYYTGTHPDWRGRGIATALKVRCLQEAKRRGLGRMETENHEDNAAMLAINRKLGFQFTAPGVACVKRL